MARCRACKRRDPRIARVLGLCADCLRAGGTDVMHRVDEVHARERRRFDLPAEPPDDPDGPACRRCHNQCRIAEGGTGYCGARRNEGGNLRGGTARQALVSWYHDPLPTNCVASWVCAAGSGQGQSNLAVFYEACCFDCLFCQNWHFRHRSDAAARHSARELADAVSPRTACICFFGGDPTPQLPHAFATAHEARRRHAGRPLRICWETNGSMAPELLDRMMDLSLESGGCVKFDLKAFDPNLHRALCGVGNERTLENFAAAARRVEERPDPPPLIASTLLVPGYVDREEVSQIASYVADLDPDIPYSLLGFHGDFLMSDLDATSRSQADGCVEAARQAGLTTVHVGNEHILRPW